MLVRVPLVVYLWGSPLAGHCPEVFFATLEYLSSNVVLDALCPVRRWPLARGRGYSELGVGIPDPTQKRVAVGLEEIAP